MLIGVIGFGGVCFSGEVGCRLHHFLGISFSIVFLLINICTSVSVPVIVTDSLKGSDEGAIN